MTVYAFVQELTNILLHIQTSQTCLCTYREALSHINHLSMSYPPICFIADRGPDIIHGSKSLWRIKIKMTNLNIKSLLLKKICFKHSCDSLMVNLYLRICLKAIDESRLLLPNQHQQEIRQDEKNTVVLI